MKAVIGPLVYNWSFRAYFAVLFEKCLPLSVPIRYLYVLLLEPLPDKRKSSYHKLTVRNNRYLLFQGDVSQDSM